MTRMKRPTIPAFLVGLLALAACAGTGVEIAPEKLSPEQTRSAESVLHVNAGAGNAFLGWSQDRFFGGFNVADGKTFRGRQVRAAGVTNAAPAAVYRTQRRGDGSAGAGGNFVYRIDEGLKEGRRYLLRLHFAELERLKKGERRFDVFLNGDAEPILKDLDIVAEAGRRRALVKEFEVTARAPSSATGFIFLNFAPGRAGEPVVNGIEVLALHASDTGGGEPSKKLIAFSSDAGDGFRLLTPEELKTQLANNAATAPPVDGITVDVSVGPQLFTKEPYPEADFMRDREALASTPYGKLKSNFIRMQSTPDDDTWSWLSNSDWAATEKNVRNVAKTAAAGDFAGILFDPEPYGTNPWTYSEARYPDRSFAEVEAVVRERGGSFMQAIQQELPNAEVLSLFLMAIVRAQTEEDSLENTQYALLRAFLEGWLDVAEDSVTLIDGNEGSYYYTATEQFENGAQYVRGADNLISTENRSAYGAQVEVAQAIYVDGLLNLWEAPEFFGFYLKNDEERRKLLEHHTYHGLKTSDEYVWVYSENVRWWRGEVPGGLRDALERAQSKVLADAPLGFGVGFVDQAVAKYDQRQSIEGTLLDTGGNPIVGAYLKSGPPVGPNRDVDAACRFSDGDGYYTCTFPSGWSGTLTPSQEGYTFSPPSRSFENVTTYTPDQDFTGLTGDEAGGEPPPVPGTQTVVYEPSTEHFLNPERGFHGNISLVEETSLDWVREGGYTLARSYVRLDDYRREPLPDSLLADVQRGLDAARAAGIKIVLRFAYNFGIGEDDTTLAWVKKHIAQLTPLLERNADVIAAVQGGFIGAWGEWHSSENGLDSPENKAAVHAALLTAVPESRMVQLRYPGDLIDIYPDPLTADGAFSGSAQARTGHMNDCFLSGELDVGTYWPPERKDEYQRYLDELTQWTVIGGETCEQQEPPRFRCDVAVPEMARFRWDYLNEDFYVGAIDRWKAEGCYDEIARRLGYRFRLIKTTAPTAIAQGSAGNFDVLMTNDGFGKLYNPRGAELVFRHQSSGDEYAIDLTTDEDPRRWFPRPGGETTLEVYANLPGDLATGTYDLFLNLPDASASLRDDPAYSVRLANQGVWEADTGYNDLNVSVEVTE